MKKWKNSFYSRDRFIKDNDIWLNEFFTISALPKNSSHQLKPYEDASYSTKRRRINDVLDQVPATDLLGACVKRMRLSKESEDDDIIETEREANYDEQIKNIFSDDEALALFIDANLTKAQYEIVRSRLMAKNVNILPAYPQITAAKSRCCSEFEVTETGASTKLQDMLDHTAKRILQVEEVQRNLLEKQHTSVHLVSKYGCDGASGFTQYRQAFTDPSCSEGNSVFMICTVPIFLKVDTEENIAVEFWRNKNPSSTKYCRTIKFAYQRETTEVITSEMGEIKKQIEELEPTKVVIQGLSITIRHTMLCTMIDGKTRQALTSTVSSQRCSICNALPKEMNNLELIMEKPVNVEACQYGLSTLHAWIRNMEWVLHLAYKLPLKKYNERLTVGEKALVQETKQQIQNKIRNEIGILVDCVKQGSGNTNDGNTARKFFQNYNKVAEVTGVDEEFVKRIYILLQVMASKQIVDISKFKIYCLDTAKLYIKMYSWYPIPSSCHMILIHGSSIIESFSVPIGQLSEEAQEARNKDFKRCRENNTRKSTAKNTNEDIMRYLFMSSDPYISSHRKVSQNKVKDLLPEAEELLIKD